MAEKVRVTFKTPDALDYALKDAGFKNLDYPESDQEESDQEEWEVAKEIISKWVEYEELITIEFDLVNKTATVCER